MDDELVRLITLVLFALLLAGCVTAKNTSTVEVCSSRSDCSTNIMNKLSSNWSRPESLRNDPEALEQMEVSFYVRLNEVFDIEAVFINRSSGNANFDKSALRAIALSEPFYELSGLPEDQYRRWFQSFNITFRPEDLVNQSTNSN